MPADSWDELIEALIGCAECTHEENTSHAPLETPAYDCQIVIGDRLQETSTQHENTRACKQISFQSGKKHKLILHVDRSSFEPHECPNVIQLVVLHNATRYHHFLHEAPVHWDTYGRSIYVVLHSSIDAVQELKQKKASYDFLSNFTSPADVILHHMVSRTLSTPLDSTISRGVSSLVVIRSNNRPESLAAVDLTRYLLKSRNAQPVAIKTRKRKRDAPSSIFSEESLDDRGLSLSQTQSKARNVYREMLCVIPHVTPQRAEVIWSLYPSMGQLLAAYRKCAGNPDGMLEREARQRLNLELAADVSKGVYRSLCQPQGDVSADRSV
ncbi:hypothetical protein XU18_1615 [Perkinsela sp. CCAP 1560/4]|nr:hypothetical protein XU18_1615 [Perkinsela sp. CCAP 1560/4]|eukprot:KNH07724.1 hypothetical protein XU18_1615 [Perkinsela sp. CCAP 1560/4]